MTGEKRDYEIGKALKRKRKMERRERKKIRRRKEKDEVKRWEEIGQNENA